MVMRNAVVGSGPCGVACAAALIARGEQVTILDVGITLESERTELVTRIASQLSLQSDVPELEHIKHAPLVHGLPLKLAYGSDFPYRGTDKVFVEDSASPALVSSFAKGGLSNVWGANVLRYRPEDLKGWPISHETLDPHYTAIERMIGLSASRDGLEQLFPFDEDAAHSALAPSEQAQAILGALNSNRKLLQRQGVYFGRARLAVDSDCIRCGNCLFGCPLGCIYTSAVTLERLRRQGVEYQPGIEVLRFQETADGVHIEARSVASHERITIKADRLLLAAGVVQTARVVLSSVPALRGVTSLKETQYFLIPTLIRLLRHDPAKERSHSLSQIFVEHVGEKTDYTVHYEIKTYNELYEKLIEARAGRMRRVFRPLIRALSKRLVVATGFLHSDYSTEFVLSVTGDRDQTRLRVSPTFNPETLPRVRAAVHLFSSIARRGGLLPLSKMAHVAEPGRSFHYGATFPMARFPELPQTDSLGRLPGISHVHVVDSSVFPTVPATTITLTAMANAHRIACECLNSEP